MREDKSKRAFTLVELLVVIVIIGVLVAILMPAFQVARMKTRNVRAKAEVNQLAMAWNALLNDYRTWNSAGVNAGGVSQMDKSDVAILAGGNPRGILYMEFNTNSLNNFGQFVDPWADMTMQGNHVYQVKLDANYANQITTGLAGQDPVYRNVAVWSTGPDGKTLITSWSQ